MTGTIATGPRSLVCPEPSHGPHFTMWRVTLLQEGLSVITLLVVIDDKVSNNHRFCHYDTNAFGTGRNTSRSHALHVSYDDSSRRISLSFQLF